MCRSSPSREGRAERTAPQGGSSPGADTALGSVHREPGPATGSPALGRRNPGSASFPLSMPRLTAWLAGAAGPDSAPLPRSAREGCREQGRERAGLQRLERAGCALEPGVRRQSPGLIPEKRGAHRGARGRVGGGGVPVGPGFAARKLRPGGRDALACAGGARAPGWVIQLEGGLGHRGGAPGSLGQGGSLGDDLIH